MSRRNLAVSLALQAVLLTAGTARAAFEDLGAGARAIGMGNAFSAVADDVQAVYYNPAGLAGLRRKELLSSYGRLFMGLDDGSNISSGFAGYAQPVERLGGSLGLAWSNLSLAGDYQEHAIRFSYGRRIRDYWQAGATLKWMMIKVGQDEYTALDPVFEHGGKDSTSAVGLDAGVLYHPMHRVKVSFVLQDFNRPDVGFQASDKLPVTLRTGASYVSSTLNLAADLYHRGRDFKVYTGIEKPHLSERFVLRGGLALGNHRHANFSFGMGLHERYFKLDYAFLYNVSGPTAAGSHRLSVTVPLGHLPADEPELRPLPQVLHGPTKRPKPKPVPKPVKKKVKPKPQWPKHHQVRAGDNLRALAVRYYGDAGRWIDIYRANRKLVGPEGDLPVGHMLVIPKGSAP